MNRINSTQDFTKAQLRISILSKTFIGIGLKGNECLEDFLKTVCKPHEFIGCYVPIKPEIDSKPIIKILAKENKIICLPHGKKNKAILDFYQMRETFILDDYRVPAPVPSEKIIIPTLCFVPCVGFDKKGNRLGRGAGCYDATLETFRKNNKDFVAIGVAWDEQELAHIPNEPHDQRLDYMITQSRIVKF